MLKEERKEAREYFDSLCDECLYMAVEEYMYRARLNSKLVERYENDFDED